MAGKRWTESEINIIKNNPTNITELLTKLPNRTKIAIEDKIRKLGISRSREWTDTEINTLVHLRSTGSSATTISQNLNRTKGSVEKKIQELIKAGKIQRIRTQSEVIDWDEDEICFLIDYYLSDYSVAELSLILDRTEGSIRGKIDRLRASGLLNYKNNFSIRKIWTAEEERELLDLNNKAVPYYEIAHLLERSVGSVMAKVWKLKCADIKFRDMSKHISRGMPRNKSTIVYLVYFIDEDFYKIGITQRTIKDRFYGQSTYEVIDSINFDSLTDALILESEVLSNMKHSQYIPNSLKWGGKTECFKSITKINSIKELL